MHAISFIQDLAVIMLVAGVVTILFHRLKQPVVLGYIVAGFIIGPHTPPFGLIHDEDTIKTLAELGVSCLMFWLGLEFSLRKLFKVGATAFIAAFLEIVLMIWVGYEIGLWFDWNTMDSLFLGAILAISSTTIIVKALNDLKMKNERFAQLIFGVLIVEDILGIGIIALLSSIAVSGTVSSGEIFSTVGKLSLFMIVALVIGILLVPRLLAYVAKFESNEMLLITVLGLCFGFCLLVVKLEYSMVLGAFLIGAIMAESRQLLKIERLIEPVRDLFSAIFFVAIGLMLDPMILLQYAWPIAVITVAVVLGKVLSCGLGAFIAGNDGRTSLRVGMGLSQIGEFSFIIAALGMTLQVTSNFLYPVAVAVSDRGSCWTCKVMPSAAMMKENSPICERPIPTRSEVLPSLPAIKAPRPQESTLPSTTATVITAIGHAYCSRIIGSSIRPMATKKMALNRSRTGSIRRSIFSSCLDSAMIAPIRKAPRTMLYSSLTTNRQKPKHSPSTVISSISLLSNLAT